MTPLQLGIIGCGTIGAAHAQAAAASDQIELVAVADVQPALAEKTAAAYTVESVYNSGAELLTDARVEAVVLALPAIFRIELGLQALRAGKHLLTEKPVARNAGEVRQLISVQGDRVAACCSSRFHFLEAARTVTDYITQGNLGALRLLRCRAIFPGDTGAGDAPAGLAAQPRAERRRHSCQLGLLRSGLPARHQRLAPATADSPGAELARSGHLRRYGCARIRRGDAHRRAGALRRRYRAHL